MTKRWGKKYVDNRNWKEYNERLVKRGELYLSIEYLENWENDLTKLNRNKVGAPFEYPECFMKFLGFIHIMLGIDYRGLEGFVRGLRKFVTIPSVPDYTTISRRVNNLNIEINETLMEFNDDVVVSLDSSGVKVANRGDWIRKVWKVRRGWIKVHLAVTNGKKQCVAVKVTDEKVGDNKKFKPLVEEAQKNISEKGGKISQVNADGSYDTRANFNLLEEMEITPSIKIRENAAPKARGSLSRKEHVLEYQELGYEKWREKYEYGKRWYVESTFSAVKRKTGEHVSAIKLRNMYKEAQMKFLFYNMLVQYDHERRLVWGQGGG